MKLVRWDPFRELVDVHERLSRAFSGDLRSQEGYGAWVPPVDIFEKGDDLVIRAELPGVEKDEIEVHAENGNLVIRGNRKREVEVDEENAYRLERVFGSFTRSFTLPTTVDASKITARHKNGVLEIVLPKAEEAKPKRVKIQAA